MSDILSAATEYHRKEYNNFGRLLRIYQRKRFLRNLFFSVLVSVCLIALVHHNSTQLEDSLSVHLEPTDHFRYCIQYNFTRSYDNFRVNADLEPVTLAMHSSIDFLHYMFDQVTTWEGAISLSVFIDRNVPEYLSYLYRIHDCDEDVRRHVSFHIVTIFDMVCDPIVIQKTWDCSLYLREDTINYLRSIRRSGFIYPINVMRNVARRGAQSKIHILSDIEMVFSLDAERLLTRVANKLVTGKKKIVLVIRRFEVEDGLDVPRTAEKLYDMFLTNRSVVEFHAKLFPEGHFIPYINSWFEESLNSTKIRARGVPYSNSFWEPQVVIHAYDPMHDETIPTRHRDHQALAYELCRAGYRFFVVTNIFNVHRGIKKSTTFLDNEVARLGQEANLLRSRIFFRRMNLLYPTTYLKCARWDNRKVAGRARQFTSFNGKQNEFNTEYGEQCCACDISTFHIVHPPAFQMHCLTVTLFFFCPLALASSALKANSFDVNVPSFNVNSSDVMANRVVGSNGVTCIDKDLEYAINYAVGQYRGNMDGLARYLLNVATRKGGYWLAQANVIARVKQGSDWQSLTNGQLFTNRDQFGCFYHDNVIFAYIVKIL